MPLLSVTMPPFPAVLPFPGVPPIAVGFGAALGLPGGGISGGIAVDPGGGLSGAVSGGVGPFQGGLSFGPGGITGNLQAGIGGLSVGISGSIGGDDGLSPFGLSMISALPPLLTQDEPGGLFQGPQWGIFDSDGQVIASWDSVLKVDYRHEMKISDFPIEEGGFASYNKVQVPYDVRISFVVGSGSGPDRRTAMLADLEDAVKSLAFYTVTTPDAQYPRANLTHLEYSRQTERGVNLLVCDVWVSEVRPALGAAFSNGDEGDKNPQSPTAKGAGNNGATQATPVTETPPPVSDPSSMQAFPDAPQMILEPMPTLNSGTSGAVLPPADMPGESVPPVVPAPNPPANAPAVQQAAPYKDLIF